MEKIIKKPLITAVFLLGALLVSIAVIIKQKVVITEKNEKIDSLQVTINQLDAVTNPHLHDD